MSCLTCGRTGTQALHIGRYGICPICLHRIMTLDSAQLSVARRRQLVRLYGGLLHQG